MDHHMNRRIEDPATPAYAWAHMHDFSRRCRSLDLPINRGHEDLLGSISHFSRRKELVRLETIRKTMDRAIQTLRI
jgi:hypothetical protein